MWRRLTGRGRPKENPRRGRGREGVRLMGQSNSRDRLHRLMMEDFSERKEKAALHFEPDEEGRITLERIEPESSPQESKEDG